MAFPQADSGNIHSGNIRFGVFETDLRSGQLLRNGIKVRIQDMPFRALTVLLGRPGEVVSRDELRQALWPENVFVDFDQGISSAIRRLRDALGDSADNPIFIETVERRGYRWIAPIHYPEAAPPHSEAQIPLALPPAPVPSRRSSWRGLVFVLPLIALVFAVWIYRPGYRSAKAGTNRAAAPPVATVQHHAANREAEDYYLKGRFYWNKRTPEGLNLAVDSFTQAIVHDSNYSDAYVGLADCYNLLREYTLMPANEAYPRALAAAKKAVELDDSSSAAHASLAFVSFYGMWDSGTADQEFRRAIDLDPNNANAHHWYATYLHTVLRSNESLLEIDRAQALDPNSSSILSDKGRLLWVAGRHAEALHLLRQLEQADPDSVSPHRYLRLADLDVDDYPGYISEMKKEASLVHSPALSAIAQAAEKGFAARGAKGMLEGQLDQQKKAYAQGRLSPFFAAETSALLGNNDLALKYLEAGYDRHDDEMVNIALDSELRTLHAIPEFQQLLAKVGLPPVN
jgi:DNA-binding winged helix-turn-helix (wHTH) protein/Tfp pilus assembly protein PilF